MKRIVKRTGRFVNKYPWIGGVPLTLAWSALIYFCLYAWKQCGPDDLPPDMFAFLNNGFRNIFLALGISLCFALVFPIVFLFVRRRDNVGASVLTIAGLLLFVVPSFVFLSPMALLVYEKLNPDECKSWTVQCASIDDPVLGIHQKRAKSLLPQGATDIYISCNPGCFIGGGCDFFRCKVTPSDLMAFIKEKGYKFRFDSSQKNENSEYPQAALGWPNDDGTSLSGVRSFNGLGGADEYWSYNYIYTNNGGYRMFYDVKRQLFYYEWSSN